MRKALIRPTRKWLNDVETFPHVSIDVISDRAHLGMVILLGEDVK
jgi:hypothetical protein